MKIAVLGFSGAGKSTLAARLGQALDLPVLHLDRVHWLPGWVEQEKGAELEQVGRFLDTHDRWVIDGNYLSLWGERRLEEADLILLLQFSRWTCLKRVIRRQRENRGRSRPSMTQGCPEKLDQEFLCWILRDGRNAARREEYRGILTRYPQKALRFTNPRALEHWKKEWMKQRTGDAAARRPREEP